MQMICASEWQNRMMLLHFLESMNRMWKIPVSLLNTRCLQEEFTKRIRETLKKYPYLAAEQNGEIVGYAYASPFKGRPAYDWAVETTVYLKENAKGKGIGRQLYTALEDILRKQNITNANACITYPNPESIGFHEKMGYRIVGHFSKCGYKDGQWRDVVWMEKFLQEHLEKPEAVIPVGRLQL